MVYVVCTRDCKDYAFGDVVNRFPDDKYALAVEVLRRLNRVYGYCFTLQDH